MVREEGRLEKGRREEKEWVVIEGRRKGKGRRERRNCQVISPLQLKFPC